jgi:hypothetical protein
MPPIPFLRSQLGFMPPTSAPELLAAMQSAATYAELSLLASSWEPNEIERQVYGRDWNKKGPYKLRGTFYSTRDGSNISSSHANTIRSLFPDSHLGWWRRHPIAEILCEAKLGQDGILDALNTLPEGPERQCIWDEGWASLFTSSSGSQAWEPHFRFSQ